MVRTLPRWKASMSDGCSIPPILQGMITTDVAMHNACVRHDELYYYGGTEGDRLKADLKWAVALIDAGVAFSQVWDWLGFVRAFGGPEFRSFGVSWSFGGEVFAYTETPATPVD